MRLREQSAKLSRGGAVHHPHHGIGRVQSIGKRSFGGASDTKFAQLYFKRESLTLILPLQDAAETMRSPINREQARQILDHIQRWDGRTSKQWKARAAAHQEAMDRGDPFEYGEVLKSLCQLETTATLRQTDRAHLEQAMNFLADELSFALGAAPEQVRNLLIEAASESAADQE